MPSPTRTPLALLTLSLLACGTPAPPDLGTADGGPLPDEGPFFPDGAVACADDAACDDGVDCTLDECVLPNGFCRNITRSALCQDELYCNGAEVCDPTLGCVDAPNVETCDDQDVCTVDRCVEADRMCVREPRDLDDDGDVDLACGGTDCDDRDPLRGGTLEEVCGDGIDNDCDDVTDEADCEAAG